MTSWLDVPLGRHSRSAEMTWGSLAERFDRCTGRAAFYVGQRVQDRRAYECIVKEILTRNVDLLVAEDDELEELRRLRTTADCLIATRR